MAEALIAQGGRDWDDFASAGVADLGMLVNGFNPDPGFMVHPDLSQASPGGIEFESEADYNRRILAYGVTLPTLGRIASEVTSLATPSPPEA
jgi:hypothetical protein